MWIAVLILVTFIVFGAAQRGWNLYMHDPGPAEYLVSLIYLAAIIIGMAKLFKRF
jgi:hypothetical protein